MNQHYRNGLLDALQGLPPAWLGIDGYKYAYERGLRAVQELENDANLLVLGVSDDRTAYAIVHVPSGVEVYVYLDSELQWRASVPGYGCRDFSLARVVYHAVTGGPCWGYNGVGVDGRGQDVRRWFTSAGGPGFGHKITFTHVHRWDGAACACGLQLADAVRAKGAAA